MTISIQERLNTLHRRLTEAPDGATHYSETNGKYYLFTADDVKYYSVQDATWQPSWHSSKFQPADSLLHDFLVPLYEDGSQVTRWTDKEKADIQQYIPEPETTVATESHVVPFDGSTYRSDVPSMLHHIAEDIEKEQQYEQAKCPLVVVARINGEGSGVVYSGGLSADNVFMQCGLLDIAKEQIIAYDADQRQTPR